MFDVLDVVATGGTIDKVYGDGKGIYDVHIGDPVVGRILEEMKYNGEFDVTSLLRKDSLDMEDVDRELIAKHITNQDKTGIHLVTHGTDTMIETAKVIDQITEEQGRVVVLLGAAQPYSMKKTDAEFNVGVGIGVIETLKSNRDMLMRNLGTYIVMNGEVFLSGEVEKGEDGVFRRI